MVFDGLRSLFTRHKPVSRPENLRLIHVDTLKLTTALEEYTGGFIPALPVSNAERSLISALQNAIQDAEVFPFEEKESGEIKELITTLSGSMKTCMAALQAKRDEFKAAKVLGILILEIKGMRGETGKVVDAILKGGSEVLVGEIKPVMEAIYGEFDKAIEYCS